jgi:hypothetical protein
LLAALATARGVDAGAVALRLAENRERILRPSTPPASLRSRPCCDVRD